MVIAPLLLGLVGVCLGLTAVIGVLRWFHHRAEYERWEAESAVTLMRLEEEKAHVAYWKQKAGEEQRRADLALDRLINVSTAAPPVSQTGIQEQGENEEKLERHRAEMDELFAPETGRPLGELNDMERIG